MPALGIVEARSAGRPRRCGSAARKSSGSQRQGIRWNQLNFMASSQVPGCHSTCVGSIIKGLALPQHSFRRVGASSPLAGARYARFARGGWQASGLSNSSCELRYYSAKNVRELVGSRLGIRAAELDQVVREAVVEVDVGEQIGLGDDAAHRVADRSASVSHERRPSTLRCCD